MSKLPFLPLWTDDYLGATRHLTTAEHGAYRRAFDTSELSPVKSGLDIGSGGGGGGAEAALTRIEAVAFADVDLRRIEATIPGYLLTVLRAVALHDQDFSAVALARYGSSTSRPRDRVRQEFLAGADQLVGPPPVVVTPPTATEPAIPPPVVAGAFLDDRGMMRPLAEIADIIRAAQSDDEQEAA